MFGKGRVGRVAMFILSGAYLGAVCYVPTVCRSGGRSLPVPRPWVARRILPYLDAPCSQKLFCCLSFRRGVGQERKMLHGGFGDGILRCHGAAVASISEGRAVVGVSERAYASSGAQRFQCELTRTRASERDPHYIFVASLIQSLRNAVPRVSSARWSHPGGTASPKP